MSRQHPLSSLAPRMTLAALKAHSDRHAVAYALLGFAGGFAIGALFSFDRPLAALLSLIVDSYGVIAPIVIYLILAPTLLRMLKRTDQGEATTRVRTILGWIVSVRAIACLFGIILVSLAYGLAPVGELAAGGLATALEGIVETFRQLMLESSYIYAIYATLLTCFLLRRREGRVVSIFMSFPDAVERVGESFTYFTPLFTFLVGVYVTTLPTVLANELNASPSGPLMPIEILGWQIDPTNEGGILAIYLAVSFLTGAVCTLWHICLLVYARLQNPWFNVQSYLRDYFGRIYPLLFATSSEALSTPLNLHLLSRWYPQVRAEVRQLTLTLGSIFNINGTLICCFVMVPATCMLLGLDVTTTSLLLCLPVIYIIGFGVPGIPGELVLFAGPIMEVLAVPPEAQAAFLLVFISIQIGLPDSFRTGANSTDDCLAAIIINKAGKQDPGTNAPG
ncbi:MAG: cation:dicarboxylase symporter family transporter [Gammaproteobacteria bacterium]|nr:cation:dicarboxylase symporter family transporter [Gammaproteobacteria bacterium]